MTALHNIRSRLFSEVQYMDIEQFCVLDNSVSTSENICSNMYGVWLVNPKILRVKVILLSFLLEHDIRFFARMKILYEKRILKAHGYFALTDEFWIFMWWNKTLFHITDNDYCLQGMNFVTEYFVENTYNICSIILKLF